MKNNAIVLEWKLRTDTHVSRTQQCHWNEHILCTTAVSLIRNLNLWSWGKKSLWTFLPTFDHSNSNKVRNVHFMASNEIRLLLVLLVALLRVKMVPYKIRLKMAARTRGLMWIISFCEWAHKKRRNWQAKKKRRWRQKSNRWVLKCVCNQTGIRISLSLSYTHVLENHPLNLAQIGSVVGENELGDRRIVKHASDSDLMGLREQFRKFWSFNKLFNRTCVSKLVKNVEIYLGLTFAGCFA